MKKLIPITGYGYTKNFFEMNFDEVTIEDQPRLELESYHTATLAIQLNDDGLADLGITKGAYLLFSPSADTYRDQVLLVRQEGNYIIRIGSHIDPLEAILTIPGDIYPPLHLNAENIRIVAVMNGFILLHDGIVIHKNDELV